MTESSSEMLREVSSEGMSTYFYTGIREKENNGKREKDKTKIRRNGADNASSGDSIWRMNSRASLKARGESDVIVQNTCPSI